MLLASAVVLLSTSYVSAVSTGGVGGRPANPDPDNPRTQSIFIYTLTKGALRTDQIYLTNGGDSEATIELYAVDGVVTNTGAFTCEQQVEPRDGVGKWLKLAKNEITLPSKGTMLEDFTITMPDSVDVGEHNGCIVIQRKGDTGETTGNVNVRTRQAVRVAVTVPGTIYRRVTVENLNATSRPNGQAYTFSLKNEGNVSADVDVSLTLKNVFTNREVYKNGGQYVVIAGKQLNLNFDGDVQLFFGGWYKVQVAIDYDKRAGVFGTYDKSKLVHSESEVITIFVWPSVWAVSLLVGVLTALGYIGWKRRNMHQKPRPHIRL